MWTYGGVRIYAQNSSKNAAQILARLQPVNGGTVIQSFGYDSSIRNISAIVVGDTNESALEAFAKDGGTEHELVSYEGSLGNWILKSFSSNRRMGTCQTIDTTQDEDAPVYDVELELHRED